MFGRKNARGAVADVMEDVVGTVSPYAETLGDERSRKRLGRVLVHGGEAQKRARAQVGLAGTLRRLSTDEVLRGHLAEMAHELGKLQRRVERKRSHKLRNTFLLLAGGGALFAFGPRLWRKLGGFLGGNRTVEPSGLTTIEEQVEVSVPVSTAYNQWTQFEDFPLFMEGVDHVRQLDDTKLHWVASIGGKPVEWDAKIVEQRPDERIVWESLDGKQTRGTVRFDKLGEGRTRIHLAMSYRPEGTIEKVGSALGVDRRRVRGDLDRFRELIESRGAESGAWRGEVEAGTVQQS
jgi:uncharacterized membrane protein